MKQFDLDVIKQVISAKYDWGQTADWTNFHFKELSKAIEEKTGDRISEETLKRIFGKRKVNTDNYSPQAFSQITLLRFVEIIRGNENKDELNTPENSNPGVKIINRKSFVWAILLVVILTLPFLYLLNQPEDFQFKCINCRDTAPFTATFSYEISDISDSVFTDFGNNEETYLPPEKSMINYFFPLPGDYQVRLYTRKQMLDSTRVIAWSRDWQAGFFPNSKPELYQVFKNQQFYRQSNNFYAVKDDLKAEGVDLDLRYWTEYQYFSNFKNSLDQLTLETRVMNNASTGSLTCYDAEIKLLGDSGIIDFKFTQPKCSRWASLRVSEKSLDGKYNDLSHFTVDMSDWLQLKMVTAGGICNIYLADNLIFTQKYEKQLGMLVGVVYKFYGSGKIDYLDLRDSEGKTFYSNEFGTIDQRPLSR